MSVAETLVPAPLPAGAPPCPITGQPARRLIQSVSKSLIEDIWRYGQGVDVKALFKDVKRFNIYESPTGLVYFDPMIVGDGKFYGEYYDKWAVHKALTYLSDTRVDFVHSAKYVPEGGKVIDVGCGPGVFRHHVTHAHYTGLDPYAAADADPAIVRETLEKHAAENPGIYDVAVAYHVIEHVPDPRRHAELMVQLLKPGGLLILAAPLFPSPLTEIPNLPINMPPHHVTWWNPSAFTALAGELDLDVVEATALPPSPHQNSFFWLHKLLFRRTYHSPDERYYAHRWSWHASLVLAYLGMQTIGRFRGLPSTARPVDAYLVARKR